MIIDTIDYVDTFNSVDTLDSVDNFNKILVIRLTLNVYI